MKPGLEGRNRGEDGGGGGGGGGGIFEQQRASMFEIIGDTLSDQSPDPRLGLCLLRFFFFFLPEIRWSTHTHTLHAKRNNIREMVCRLKDGGQTSTRKKKKAEGRFLSALERSVKLSCSSHSHHNLRVESALTSSEIHPSTGLNLPEKLNVRGRNTLNELFIKHFSRH